MQRRRSDRIVAKTVLPVVDMNEAVDFYRRLGFEVEAFDGGYAWVRHDGEEILHLAAHPDMAVAANRAAGYLHVQDAGRWYEAWSGHVDVGPLEDHAWGMREFAVRDPSNNLLRVGQNT